MVLASATAWLPLQGVGQPCCALPLPWWLPWFLVPGLLLRLLVAAVGKDA
jgi:hypothetical protein